MVKRLWARSKIDWLVCVPLAQDARDHEPKGEWKKQKGQKRSRSRIYALQKGINGQLKMEDKTEGDQKEMLLHGVEYSKEKCVCARHARCQPKLSLCEVTVGGARLSLCQIEGIAESQYVCRLATSLPYTSLRMDK